MMDIVQNLGQRYFEMRVFDRAGQCSPNVRSILKTCEIMIAQIGGALQGVFQWQQRQHIVSARVDQKTATFLYYPLNATGKFL